MKTIDIDSCDPGYELDPWGRIPKRQRKGVPTSVMERSIRIHVSTATRWNHRLGVKPQTMLNWRHLERRMAQLGAAWREADDKFWKLAGSFRDPGMESNHTVVFAVEDPVATGDDSVICFSDHGYSHDTQSNLIERHLQNSEREDPFKFVSYAEGGREVGRLRNQSFRLSRAHAVYRRTFERAIVDRLLKHHDFLPDYTHHGAQYYSPATVLIENEGRFYAFIINSNGQVCLMDGNVYLPSKEMCQ